MGANVTIDIDQHTTRLLEMPAAELGVTVPELIAELAALDSTPRDADAAEIAEVDRRGVTAELRRRDTRRAPRCCHDARCHWSC